MTKLGVDVSTWQPGIDFQELKQNGVEFAILRSSFGSPSPSQVDNEFENHYQNAKAANMPIGAYHYGYAVSEEEARQEARFFIDTVKGKEFTYPLYYDVEDAKTMGSLSRQALTNVVKAFCEEVKAAGYFPGVYANLNWLENKLYADQLPYEIWVAQYYKECQYEGNYGMWQYTSTGSAGRFSGLDLNHCYQDYPAVIAAQNGQQDKPQETTPETTTSVICTGNGVRIRAEAHTAADILGCANQGDPLTLLDDDGWGWSKVTCNGVTGWMSNAFISASRSGYKTGICNGTAVNVRSVPSMTGNTPIRQMNPGDTFTVVSINPGGWIDIGDGYVYYDRSYIDIQ